MEDFFEKIDTLYQSLQKYKKNKDQLLSTIKSLSHQQKKEMNIIINKIDIINQKINNISDDIDDLQYHIDTNELEKLPEVEERIEIYQKNQKVYKTFLPYMLFYSLLLDS